MKICTDLGIWDLSLRTTLDHYRPAAPPPPPLPPTPTNPPPEMKIWTDLGTWDLNWSGVTPPRRVETRRCIPQGYRLVFEVMIVIVSLSAFFTFRFSYFAQPAINSG